MHWGGYVCNSVGLNNVAAEFGVPVIEDAAQAIGALVGSEYVGNQSRYTCFSFQAIKQLTTGDGGLLVLQSSEEHKRARLMRWFGLDRLASVDMRCGQDPPEYGYKMHMNDIAATIGLANLGTLIERVLVARSNASLYDSLIKSVRTIKPDYGNPSPWVYTVFVENQQRFIAYLTDNGIAASKVHDSNYDKTIFKDSLWCDGLPGVEYFDSHHVCIPVGWWVTDNDAKYIAETVNAYSNVA
jgi:dTDP-4-amino-4,6-dideoxygalactose transaminase